MQTATQPKLTDIIIPESYKQYFQNNERVVKYPDFVLKSKCMSVNKFDDYIKKLVDSMKQILIETRGLGLSAPQVGVLSRIIIIGTSAVYMKQRTPYLVMINPILLKSSGEEEDYEGCLSLPGLLAKVKRPTSGSIEYYDIHGKKKKISLHGVTLRACLHEMDHLEGILFFEKADLSSIVWLPPNYNVI